MPSKPAFPKPASPKPASPKPAPPKAASAGPVPHILAIDIGGSHLKAGILDQTGMVIGDPGRVPTPSPATPTALVAALQELVRPLPPFGRISVGFPGVVRDGTILTAPNLGTAAWRGFPLAKHLEQIFATRVRVLNDANIQGLGVISGQGLECAITLGTGMGFALFRDGDLMPQMEMGQHIAHGKHIYDQYVGQAGLKSVGLKRWNKRVRKTIDALTTLLNFDRLYVGGGNATRIAFDLPAGVHVVSNAAGITGGARLWDPKLDAAFEK